MRVAKSKEWRGGYGGGESSSGGMVWQSLTMANDGGDAKAIEDDNDDADWANMTMSASWQLTMVATRMIGARVNEARKETVGSDEEEARKMGNMMIANGTTMKSECGGQFPKQW